MSGGPFLYPNVTSVPVQSDIQPGRIRKSELPDQIGEFDRVLENVKEPLKFSAHATQRLRDRKIDLDPATMAKVSDAIDRAQAKGIEDTLVLTKDAALIVSVKNRIVVTALDRNSIVGNIFTNIDGAVVV